MRILILSPDASLQAALAARLAAAGHELVVADTAERALALAASERFQVLVAECRGPAIDGLGLLRRHRAASGACPVLLLMGAPAAETVEQALREGAFDCLPLETPVEMLLARLRQVEERERLRDELATLRARLGGEPMHGQLVGEGDVMRQALAQAAEVASRGLPALIVGEAGTGTSAFARAIHATSDRAGQRLAIYDAAALPIEVLERELFADRLNGDWPALRRAAGSGTLVLDHADALPPSLQVTVTQALEGARVPLLVLAHQAGALAAAKSVVIRLPPLRERPGEIPGLLAHFVQGAARQLRRTVSVTPDALGGLLAYRWPGNVRELEAAISHAAVLAGERTIELRDFPLLGGSAPAPAPTTLRLKPQVEAVEREVIRRALAAAHGNRRQAAVELGVSLRTLFYKLRRYNLD